MLDFIGSHLVERLVGEGHKVIVVDDLSNGRLENLFPIFDKISFLARDISKPFYKEFPHSTKSDIIYHLACFPRSMSYLDPVRDAEVNVIGMINVLELAKKTGAKVIFSSNSGIYDTSQLPINEAAADTPKSPYDLTKLTAEKYLALYNEAYNIEHVIFRFATVYGPRQRLAEDWRPVIIEFIDKLSKGIAPTIHWDGLQTRDFVYVDDIVDALVLAKDSDEALKETMILGSGVETSINEIYEKINNILGVDIEPLWGSKALGDIARMRYDCARAERILGWKAKTNLDEGIGNILKARERK